MVPCLPTQSVKAVRSTRPVSRVLVPLASSRKLSPPSIRKLPETMVNTSVSATGAPSKKIPVMRDPSGSDSS
ncbi:Uncharacterised protein [Mycobacteroides abscessus subsp. abscessus]|nr:Uncharacterised protein [Mycobacteroides abscessus subsp. abscessus]